MRNGHPWPHTDCPSPASQLSAEHQSVLTRTEEKRLTKINDGSCSYWQVSLYRSLYQQIEFSMRNRRADQVDSKFVPGIHQDTVLIPQTTVKI
ncbi:hypothetical protein LshimejAT787_0111940 [Lyophyllum shimeji]|uniref:Uncharacterized protein n=1 Tax=Lyophyllum shimeji TaxID=47721 RepID=A0A9P3PE28_LYOSH|nr:hypothetical protein LshimejAT787_0111940 [Lyophyllum shimeji]